MGKRPSGVVWTVGGTALYSESTALLPLPLPILFLQEAP
ncbi:hypothetical protein SAMN00790413_01394 [Deinococcus hopiensis KR-140]|uniref:Uncharacterized protein n=1 Tax=Deinococcus hopiensis KR-140 TaxID=695939 RepID=A0A1W1VF35_9DEIO|nr:hypothetical protein SAMN00790413_01394 [Deinococcus hopiensis KR-140]